MRDTFNKRQKENEFFAYLKDNDDFVGYVNYHYNKSEKIYECGIVIDSLKRGKGYSKRGLELLCKEARKNGIEELYDSFEIDRGNTLKIFESVGFKVIKKIKWKKFDKEVDGVQVKIKL